MNQPFNSTQIIRKLNNTLANSKSEDVAKAHIKKQVAFTDEQLIQPLTDFIAANPTSNSLDHRNFLMQQQAFNAGRNEGTLGDLGTDISIAFGDRLAQTGYGIAGLAGDALDSEGLSKFGWDGVAEQQAEALASEGEYSTGLVQAKANIHKSAEARKLEQMADGNISTGESLEGFFGTVGDYIMNPTAALSEAAKSSADIVTMAATGGIGGAAAKTAITLAALKRGATEVVAKEAGKKAALKAGTTIGTAYTGVSEGTNNAIQTRDELSKIAPEVLAESEDFKTLGAAMAAENPEVTFEQVRAQFIEEGTRDTALISGGVAAVIGKATGASSKFGNLANEAGTKGIVKETLKGAGTEAVEETLQSGSGQLVGNIQVKEGDASKDILDGVGEAAGAGAAAGGLMGGIMSGGARTVTKSAEKISEGIQASNGEAVAEGIQELQAETVEETTTTPEPVEGEPVKSTDTPDNVVEAYAPAQEPVADELAQVTLVQKVVDNFSNFKSENADVEAYVQSVVDHTLNTDLSVDGMQTNLKDFESIGGALIESFNTNTNLSTQGVELLNSGDLSEADVQAVTALASSLHPSTGEKVGYQTVAKVVNQINTGELEQLVGDLTLQKEKLGESKDTAQVSALLETLGDVVLYSRNHLEELSNDTLKLLSENTLDEKKASLINFAMAVKGNVVVASKDKVTSAGILATRNELLGHSDNSISEHASTLLKQIGQGDLEGATQTYDAYIGYLATTQAGKLDALQGLKNNPNRKVGDEVRWSTQGVLSQRNSSKGFTFKYEGGLDTTIAAVTSDLAVLNEIDVLAQAVLGIEPTVETTTPTAPVESVVTPPVKADTPVVEATVETPTASKEPDPEQDLNFESKATTSEVLHDLTAEQVLDGEVLKDANTQAELTTLLGEDVSKMEPLEVVESVFAKMAELEADPKAKNADNKNKLYNLMKDTGLVSTGSVASWFKAYEKHLAGEPLVAPTAAQQERTAEVLAAYVSELEEKAAQLDEPAEKAAKDAAEAHEAINKILPEPVERMTGDVFEQGKLLNERRVFDTWNRSLEVAKKRLAQVKRNVRNLKNASKKADMVAEQDKLIAEIADLKSMLKTGKEAFTPLRADYLAAEAISQDLAQQKASAAELARLAKQGKTPYDSEPATRTQKSRIKAIASTLAVAKYNLDLLGAAVGIAPKRLKEIVHGPKSGKQNIANAISNEILKEVLPKDFTREQAERYIQESITALGHLVHETAVGKRGGKKRLGIRTHSKVVEAFNKRFANDLALTPEDHPVRMLVDSLAEDNPLRTSIGSFRESALWDSSSVLNLDPADTVGAAKIAQEHDISVIKVMSTVADYQRFKTMFESRVTEALALSPDKVDVIASMIFDKEGNIPEYFTQSAFLGYAELMESISGRKHLPAKKLNIYLDKILRSDPAARVNFEGKGSFLVDNTVAGIAARNNLLVEDFNQNQYLPALNTFMESALVNMLEGTAGVTVATVKHNNKTFLGYTRNAEVNPNSVTLAGDNSVLKAVYGSRSERTNHIGTPPNTDYSRLADGTREMAELTESVPFYFDTVKFDSLMEAVVVMDEETNEVDEELTATNFVETYLHSPTDAYIATLNKNDADAKTGKKEGYRAEFIAAYKMAAEVKRQTEDKESPHFGKPVPIYFSSFFSVNGRQFFEGDVNPQANKLHRILVRTSFGREPVAVHGSVDNLMHAYTSTTNTEESKQLGYYILAMGLGLGVDVDKLSNEESISQTFDILTELEQTIYDQGSVSVAEHLTANREEGKEPSVEYIEALDSVFAGYSQKSLPLEIDGKTNGVFHINWLYGMGAEVTGEYTDAELLALGGMKTSFDSKDTHHDDLSSDTYQTVATLANRELDRISTDGTWTPEQVAAWEFLQTKSNVVSKIGELKRNAPKGGVTATIYGGSLNAITGGLLHGAKSGDGFRSQFYQDVSAAIGTAVGSAERAVVESWNVLLYAGHGPENEGSRQLPANMSDEKLKGYTLSDAQLKDMSKHIEVSMGMAITMGINKTIKGAKDVTDQVTLATGTMVSLYNIAARKLTEKVIAKRNLGRGVSLSKADHASIKQALRGMFPEIDLAVDGQRFLNQKANSHSKVKFQGTKVTSMSTSGSTLKGHGQPIPVGEGSLASAGVTANPNGIISVDAEMQRITTKLMKAATDSLYLNIFDAQDMASDTDIAMGALIANISETMAISEADPVREVADVLTRTIAAAKKPLMFEGEVVITNLNSLLSNGLEEFSAEYLGVIGELSSELDGRTEAGQYDTILKTTDLTASLEYIQGLLTTTAQRGEIARLDFVANNDEGTKIQQLAGIDGTAALMNQDGSFNWERMGKDAGVSESKIEQLKQLPDVIAFEERMMKRIEDRHTLNVDELTELAPDQLDDRAGMFSIFADSKATKFKAFEGYTEITLTTENLRAFAVKSVNFKPNELSTTLVQPTFDEKGNQGDLSSSNLVGQKVRIVDKNSLSKFGLGNGVKGVQVVEPSGEVMIYIAEGIPVNEALSTLQHELTHANIAGGVSRVVLEGKGTAEQIAMANAMFREMTEFMDLPHELIVGNAPLENLQLELQSIRAEVIRGDITTEVGNYKMLQEFTAHLNEHSSTGKINLYLNQDISAKLDDTVIASIHKIIKALGDMLKSLVGSWISQEKLDKGATRGVTRVMLLQAFMTEMAKVPNKGVANIPVNSKDRLNNKFRKTPLSAEQLERVSALNDKALAGINAIQAKQAAEVKKLKPGGLKEREKAEYKKIMRYSKAKLASQRNLRLLAAQGALDMGDIEVLSNLTGILSIGRETKAYQQRHLDKIYLEASNVVKVSDLVPEGILVTDPSYKVHLKNAAALHTLLFKTNDADRIARFAAFSEVSPELQVALRKVKLKADSTVHKNWFAKVRHTIRNLVDVSSQKAGGIFAADVTKQLNLIVDTMSENKNLYDRKYQTKLKAAEAKLDEGFHLGMSLTAKGIRKAFTTVTGKEVGPEFSLTEAIQDWSGDAQPSGFFRKTLMELMPRTSSHSTQADRAGDKSSSNVDAEHTGTARGVKQSLKDIFKGTLSKAQSAAIVEGDIKGDIGSLAMNHGYSSESIQELFLDEATRTSRINILQNQILNALAPTVSIAQRTMMVNEAKNLGYRMVQGGATKGMNYPNAYAISRLSGTPAETDFNPVLDEALVPLIDQLASVSAIQYTDSGVREALGGLYKSDPKAMNLIHRQVRANEVDTVERYGQNILNQIPKGGTPDIFDPNRSVKIVPQSRLKDYPTYTKLHSVSAPHSDELHYAIYDEVGGAVPYVSGAISLIDSALNLARRGVVQANDLNLWDSGSITKKNSDKYAKGLSSKIREPEAIEDGGFVPNFNNVGKITSYRYELPRAEFNRLMDTSSQWEDVLAEHAGRIHAEKLGAFYNRELVEGLYNEYKRSHKKSSWVKVSKNAKSAQVREAWQLVPEDMKKVAKAYFGEDAIYVHRDDIDQVLGYREGSVANLLKPETYEDGTYMQGMSKVLTSMFGKRAAKVLRKGELGLQEGVTTAKDLIVVKSVAVPAANIVSNINQLSLRQIPLEDIYSGILLAVNSKRAYDKTVEQMYLIKAKLKVLDKGAKYTELQNEFNILKQTREANPLHRLIAEEGLNPSVIEELGEESARDGYRKKIIDSLTARFEKHIPEDSKVVDIGKELIITQDSNIYKLLNEGLELGDFVSKYVLYNHLTQTEGMSHTAAVEQARSEFINYNRNQSKQLDYLNKTGGMFFFKYFFRKHPIIMASIKKAPSRAIMQVIGAVAIGIPSIYETTLFTKDFWSATGSWDLFSMASGAHPLI